MKVYISMDAEGISGIYKLGQVMTNHREYEFARRMMANDVNAAAEGAFQAGAEQVIVNDAHNDGSNLLIEQLDPRIDLISGTLRPLSMAQAARAAAAPNTRRLDETSVRCFGPDYLTAYQAFLTGASLAGNFRDDADLYR